jgi:hypothetical protein
MNHEATGKTYLECIRMLNGLEKSFERRLPKNERRWAGGKYGEPNTEHLISYAE